MRRLWLAAATAVLPGVLLLVWTTRGTPGVTWDAVQYGSAATSLVTQGRLETHLPNRQEWQFDADRHLVPSHTLVLWPPGYPLLIAIVMRFGGMAALPAAALVNAVSLAVFLLCVLHIVKRAAGLTTAVAVTAIVGVMPVLQSACRMALSEAPFLAACGLTLVGLTDWLRAPAARLRGSWLAALAIAAAMHLRYTGVFLVGVHLAAAAWVFWKDPATRPRWATIAASVLAGPALGTVFLWHRVATLGCALCEPRQDSMQGLLMNVREMALAIGRSLPLLYDLVPGFLDSALTGLIFVVLLATSARAHPPRLARDGAIASGLSLALALIYAAALLLVRTLVEFNSFDTRLVAPAALPLTVVALALVFRRLTDGARLRVAATMVAVLAVGGAIASRSTAWRIVSEASRGGTPFMQFAARQLQEQPGTFLFTPDAVYVVTHLSFSAPVYWTPVQGLPVLRPGQRGVVLMRLGSWAATADAIAELDRGARRIAEGPDFVAWELRDR